MAMAQLGRRAARVEQFGYGPWEISASTSHILSSEGADRQKYDSELDLPNLPEMIFAQNWLRLQNKPHGFGIEFNALDALKLVDSKHDPVKVACANEWRQSRQENEHIKETGRPYDWTFTTHYKGSLLGNDNSRLVVESTDERIDLETLKQREKILFYQDILLFEDELSDNGTSILNVKIRVMPSCLFALQRQYVRVDDVLVRVNDTRLYQQVGTNYMLREFSSKESKICDLKLAMHVIADANEVQQHLPTTVQVFEKLTFPCDVDLCQESKGNTDSANR